MARDCFLIRPRLVAVAQGEISTKDLVNRSRYVMGSDFENLHFEYLGILKQLGHPI